MLATNKRWPRNAFILYTVLANAKTFPQESIAKLKMSNLEFTYALGKLMMLQQIEKRYTKGFNAVHRRFLRIPELNRCAVTSTPAKTWRCFACFENAVGTNVYQERRQKLSITVKRSCSICNAMTFKQHTQLVCAKCNNR